MGRHPRIQILLDTANVVVRARGASRTPNRTGRDPAARRLKARRLTAPRRRAEAAVAAAMAIQVSHTTIRRAVRIPLSMFRVLAPVAVRMAAATAGRPDPDPAVAAGVVTRARVSAHLTPRPPRPVDWGVLTGTG